jgi:hypothetical protein
LLRRATQGSRAAKFPTIGVTDATNREIESE